MKSGTNQYHGSGYDYFQNTALNAGLPFTNNGNGGLVKNPLNRNDYGFTLGGPVRIPKLYNGKDKTFFFFNFEQFRQTVDYGQPDCDRAPAGSGRLAIRAAMPTSVISWAFPSGLSGLGVNALSPTGANRLDGPDLRPHHIPLCEQRDRFRVRRNPVPGQHDSVQPDGSVGARLSEVFHRADFGRTCRTTRFCRLSPTSGTPRFPRSRSIRTSARRSRYPGTIPQRGPIRPTPMDTRTSRSRPRLRSSTRKPSASITTKPSRPPCCSIWAPVFCTSTSPSIRRPLTRARSWVGAANQQYPGE